MESLNYLTKKYECSVIFKFEQRVNGGKQNTKQEGDFETRRMGKEINELNNN
jgi:hypothetical protein